MELIKGIKKIFYRRKTNSTRNDRSIIKYIELSAELENDHSLLIRKTGNMAGSYLEDTLKKSLIELIKNVRPFELHVIDLSRSSNLGPSKSHYVLRISLEEELGNVRYTKHDYE